MAMRPVYASDIYALGVTCIYLLTGKSPKNLEYNPTTGEMLWYENLDISNQFADVLRKMLEVSVRHRYQSAEEVLKALDMAPYMDSLSQGLTSKSNQPNQSNQQTNKSYIPPSGDLSGFNPSINTSASSQLGMAIRARKSRSDQTGTPLSPGAGDFKNRGMASKDSTTHPHRNTSQTTGIPKLPSKLDAPSVISYYAKGRRDFGEQNLSNLNLQKANLSGGNFHQANLTKINFQGANLSNTDFGRSSLSGALLRDANLVRAYLSYADLEGADLRGADLSFAYLHYANLRGANLCGTNLTGAKIDEEQIAQAKTNWATVLPNGKRGFW
jgi:serine/threonine-protein kinase